MDLTTLLLKVRNRQLAALVFAALLLALAITLRLVTPVTLTYVTFYPAIILATIAGGRALGVLAVLVATAAAMYFFMPPIGSFAIGISDAWNIAAFWIVCAIIIAITGLLVDVLMAAHERAEKLAALYGRLAASEKQQHILMRELSHRMKNQYSVILAMARLTGESSTSITDFEATFSNRLYSMSRAHDLLTQSGWEAVSLLALIDAELKPFADQRRLELRGEDVRIREFAVVNIGMALHELATNAAKHGAWSVPDGKVMLDWALSGGRFVITWQERDGESFVPSGRHGFGRTMLERIVPAALEGTGTITFEPHGLRWTLSLPTSCIKDEAEAGNETPSPPEG